MPDNQPPRSNIETVDLVAPTRVVRGRLPAIEAIQDRLSRQLRADMFRELRYGVQIEDASTNFDAHDEVMRNMPGPAYVGIVSMPPLRGFSVIAIEGSLIGAVVDRMCGASEPDPQPHRPEFSQLEMRIAQRVLDVIRKSVQYAWHGVVDLSIEIVRTEVNTSFIAIADGDEPLITMRMTAAMATGKGQILIGTPYPSIDPIRDRLSTTAAMTETPENDKRHWQRQMRRAASGAPVTIHADLAQSTISSAELAHLAPGQILPIRILPTTRVYSGTNLLFEAEYGTHSDNHALRVTRFNTLHFDAKDSQRHDRTGQSEHAEDDGHDGQRSEYGKQSEHHG